MNTLHAESTQFYSQLPLITKPISEFIGNKAYFHPLPEDWHIVVTDIRNSTQAVRSGLHREVNLIATGSIIAALNIGRTHNLSIPFFFGGDGATLLLPDSLLSPVLQALHTHSQNVYRNYELALRVGSVRTSTVYENGAEIRIAKTCLGKHFPIPVVLGNGLKYAEKVVKGDAEPPLNQETDPSQLDLQGMECRWNLIKPPRDTYEVVCLLINVPDQELHATVFEKILTTIDAIYGPQPERNPITIPQLQLTTDPQQIVRETQVKLGRFQWSYLITQYLITYFGGLYFRIYPQGKSYLQDLVELSDVLVLDGSINTVITGTRQQREKLTKVLEQLEQHRQILFGIHISKESVMSCYVRDRNNDHIHFVDGSQGGYTQAAMMLKEKLRKA